MTNLMLPKQNLPATAGALRWRDKTFKRGLAALSLTTLMLLANQPVAAADAQMSDMSASVVSVPTPEQPDAIPLGKVSRHQGRAEQWEVFAGTRQVRNVTEPTLTPILPDPATATGTAVIVAPGGGFLDLSIDNEGYKVGHWLADHGIAAFVLKYRLRQTPRDPAAFLKASAAMLSDAGSKGGIDLSFIPPDSLEDAKAAVRLVRTRAQEWHIDPNRVGFVGFSAGAMLTLQMGLLADDAVRPNFIAPIYGPMKAIPVPAYAPPMFIAVALDDPLMAEGRDLGLIASWRAAGRPLEVHLYEKGGHGFSMLHYYAAPALWIEEFHAWMSDNRLLTPGTMSAARSTALYSTDTPLGVLLDAPAAHAILQQAIPAMINSDGIIMARSMSLRQLHQYTPSVLTDDVLAKLDVELAKLGPKPSSP